MKHVNGADDITAWPSFLTAMPEWVEAAFAYQTDFIQRGILFAEILRQRGNLYMEHVRAGQPPVLVFDYDWVLDGRTLPRPVNYAIVRIRDRRHADETGTAAPAQGDRRKPPSGEHRSANKRRPIVIIDPRAGHGPGIGGSKIDSQIGMALNQGHPVYFILFFTDPAPGQTLADVQAAEVRFLEEVARRHPEAEKPAVIGNCQAGWAAALIGADRPDVTGPLVFNGSPLSYWGGVEGANPMRYKGGLTGGVWLTSLWSDLGNGKFDGANLVAGFEDLNPANTLWTKQYNVWANVDTEAERYLNFEKWWGGFFKMNAEEIHFIVDSLFVGNELEQGYLRLQEGKAIHLKNLRDPIVVFASQGDNITPPQQALNWIVKVYGSVDEIRRNGQVIVYVVHERIGHLGIFVSGSVAKKEHREIIGTLEMLDYLRPGLYEMIITEKPSRGKSDGFNVEFVERGMADILALDDGLAEEAAFRPVAAVSRFNDRLYRIFVSPWVRLVVDEWTAEVIRQLHPLRVQRYIFSDLNPMMGIAARLAHQVKANRQPAAPENPFVVWERYVSESTKIFLDCWRDIRDTAQETLFRAIYDNGWMKTLFPETHTESGREPVRELSAEEAAIRRELWLQVMERGGFAEAVVRIILAVAGANKATDRRQYAVATRIIQVNNRLMDLAPDRLKWLVKQQSAVLEKDPDLAIQTLATLLPKTNDRIEAFEIANSIASADLELDAPEQKVLLDIKHVLGL